MTRNVSADDKSNFIPSAGAGDKIQTDPTLDGFEYFLEKGKEKEDDLHKSYNDRSYLSSEEVGSGESRTGEWQPAWTHQPQHNEQLLAKNNPFKIISVHGLEKTFHWDTRVPRASMKECLC